MIAAGSILYHLQSCVRAIIKVGAWIVLVFVTLENQAGFVLEECLPLRLLHSKMSPGLGMKANTVVGIPPEIDTLMLIKFLNQVWSQFCGVKHKLHLCLCLQISPTNTRRGKPPLPPVISDPGPAGAICI